MCDNRVCFFNTISLYCDIDPRSQGKNPITMCLKKVDFSATHVEKTSKEHQPKLKELFGKNEFGQLIETKDPMKGCNDFQKQIQTC
jgi:hypothetical protein